MVGLNFVICIRLLIHELRLSHFVHFVGNHVFHILLILHELFVKHWVLC